MKNSDEPNSATPRHSWKTGRVLRIAYSGEPGAIAGIMIRPNTRKRSQAISIDGRVDDRYFAVTSDVPRKIVESRISAMPRNGRSARAGATGASGLFSGTDFSGGDSSDDVTGAWSSRAAAAGGGVTEDSEGKGNNRIGRAAR